MQSVCDLALLFASQLLTFTPSLSSSKTLCLTCCWCLSTALWHCIHLFLCLLFFFPPPSFSSSFGFSSVLHICQLLPLFSLLLFHISSFCIFSSCCIVWCCPPLKYFGPPPPPPFPFPFLKSVWSPLILSAPRVVVLGWMSALWIRGLKRAEQQPKPWNPLNLSFSLSCFNWHC